MMLQQQKQIDEMEVYDIEKVLLVHQVAIYNTLTEQINILKQIIEMLQANQKKS